MFEISVNVKAQNNTAAYYISDVEG